MNHEPAVRARDGAAVRGRLVKPASRVARYFTRLTLALGLLAPGLAAPPCEARELTIEQFDALIEVAESGTIEVTEHIRFRFEGSWNGIIRSIPIDYRTPQGFNYHLRLDQVVVTDDGGAPLEVESKQVRHNRELKIWVPGANDAVRAITVHYRVANALRFFDRHDELYWNVTGDEWEMPIEGATARIVLPDRATNVRATAFSGAYGSKSQDAEVTIEGHEVQVSMTRPLAFREGLTVVAGFDKGAVREPGVLENAGGFLAVNLPLLVPVLAALLMFVVWRRLGRDPQALPISVQYEPPGGLTPAEAGTLLDHRTDMRDVTATLVDLAVKGYMTIQEEEQPGFLGIGSSTEYTFTRRRPAAEWTSLAPHERDVMDGLFKDGDRETVKLSELKNEFYRSLSGIRDHVFEGLEKRGYYLHRPDHVRTGWMIVGGIVAFLSGHVAAFGSAMLGLPAPTLFIATLFTGLVIVAFGWFMPARTLKGARAWEAVRGFEEFLGRVESDRMERVVRTPEMFERLLPFAMAFGVEDRWSRAFEGILTVPPTWYHGRPGTSFRPTVFGHSLAQMSTSAASTLASSPRSSSGSGLGGGGSSGGGFGGGGGRGF